MTILLADGYRVKIFLFFCNVQRGEPNFWNNVFVLRWQRNCWLIFLQVRNFLINLLLFFFFFQRNDALDERDREDAISFASRRSLAQGGAKVPQPGGTVPRHALTTASSMRSKRSVHSTSSKKYPPEGSHLSGHHTTNSYSLWSAQNSLKREHKRKFNRSLCGVLLGISIVLVILGILGIIGIAVYLGGKYYFSKVTIICR